MTAGLPEIPPWTAADGDVKMCCADLYASEAARWLIGDQLHPGGERTTRRLAELALLAAGERVLDVAAGLGSTARLLALRHGATVVGIELAQALITRARAATTDPRVTFVHGDAEALPFPDATFDLALSECALCTFPDKPRAIAEMARVVRPGGRIAIADVTADVAALPPPLRSAAARVACVADARTEDGSLQLLADAGCEPIAREACDSETLALIDRVEARLRVARMLVADDAQRERVREALALARTARAEAERGRLGYVLVVATVGRPRAQAHARGRISSAATDLLARAERAHHRQNADERTADAVVDRDLRARG
jgi:SAM-dependent methyltransferase